MKRLIIYLALFSSLDAAAACFDRSTSPLVRVCAYDLPSIPKDVVINTGNIAATCSHNDCELKRDDQFVFKGSNAIRTRSGEKPVSISFTEFEREYDQGRKKIRFLKGSVNGFDYYVLYHGEQECKLTDSRYKKDHICKKYYFEIFSSNNTSVLRPEDAVWIDRAHPLEPSTGGGTDPPVDP